MFDSEKLKELDKYQSLKEIDKEVIARYSPKAVLDGIVDFYDDNFEKAKKKILWVLKEPNMRNQNAYKEGYFDLSEHLREMKSNHPSFRTTWKFLLEVSNAIMENAQDWENEVTIGNVLLNEGLMKQIAVIEIKKTFGGGHSDQKDINSYYTKDKDIILAQIDAIAPDFIFNASRVDALFNDLKVGEVKEVSPFQIAKWKGGIIINVHHPASCKGEADQKTYFELVRDCIRAIA